ncbi:putative lipid carrier protein [Gammaproteobacteria bacterium MOLA455]|nr:putative lipid carrier protein [Gammaproteobacteria bacterium MOLA455]
MIKLNPYQKILLPSIKGLSSNCPFPVQKKIVRFLLLPIFEEARLDGDLEFLSHRRIGLAISDIDYQATLSLENGHLTLASSSATERPPDAIIRGNLSAFIQLANRAEDPDSLFFQRRLSIEGDTDLALEVKNVIDTVDLDRLPEWLKKALSLSQRMNKHFLDKKAF